MKSFLVTMMVFSAIGLVLSIFFLIRNEIVGNIRKNALDIIYNKMLHDINVKKISHPPGDLAREFDKYGSYNKMLFSLTKWKFKHFYSDL